MKKKSVLPITLIAFLTYSITSHAAQYEINPATEQIKVVLMPKEKAVISTIIDSTVKVYNFKEGEPFKKDDIVLLLDDAIYNDQYLIAKAQNEKANASYAFYESTFNRYKGLREKGSMSVQEFESIELYKTNTKFDMSLAEANLSLAKEKLDACTIRAPFSGIITKKILQEYELAEAAEPIVELINDNELLAVMYFPSNMIDKIKMDEPMTFHIDEINATATGTVYETAGYILSSSRCFEVKAIIDNSDRKLFAGMSGTLLQDTGR